MERQIWKFTIGEVAETFAFDMPDGARILDCQLQRGIPQLWALVDPHAPKVTRSFMLLGTGHTVDLARFDQVDHVATFQLRGGELVFHVFEVDPRL